jgi:hypothetical protein
MVAGAPQVAPDAIAVEECAAAGVSSALPIGNYVGVPIQRATHNRAGMASVTWPATVVTAITGRASRSPSVFCR